MIIRGDIDNSTVHQRHWNGKDQSIGFPIKIFHTTRQTAVQYLKVNSYIKIFRRLPCYAVVRQRTLRQAWPIRVIPSQRIKRLIRVIANTSVVSDSSIRGTELKHIDFIFVDKLFLTDVICSTDRPKRRPPKILMKPGVSISP